MATVADIAYVQIPQVVLPYLDSVTPEGFNARKDFSFTLPAGTQPHGAMAAEILTVKGTDDGIDLSFNVYAGYTWTSNYRSSVFLSRVWAVSALGPGQNTITFELEKYGTIETSHGSYNGGGKGRLNIANVILWYHREVG